MRIPSIVILGADALLAARPATPIQLAHACGLAGYQHVIPASWGDELIAAASLRTLRDHPPTPAIQCSCPFVAHRLLAVGTDLRPFLVSLVAPPVVLARYLRAAFASGKLRITYVGRCPGAADEVIDARLTPEELLAIFSDHQIVVEEQPEVFESVIPPDRRRFRSQPGGLPTGEMLWSAADGGTPRALVELYGDELPVELAQHLLAGKPVLIDVASKLGCVCSGALGDVDPAEARARVAALEPPRATSPVVDEAIVPDASLALPVSPRSVIDIVSPPTLTPAPHSGFVTPTANGSSRDGDDSLGTRERWPEEATPGSVQTGSPGRRHSPARGVARLAGSLPTARDAGGRQLPRSYVALRRPATRHGRGTPSDVEAPIPSSSERTGTEVMDRSPDVPPGSSARKALAQDTTLTTAVPATVTPTAPALATEATERVTPLRVPPAVMPDESSDSSPRFAERAVALPVTRLSDARPRDSAPANLAGDRPVMQLLTLGLLIAMVVLVSAAVGVLVGRWMSQH